MFEIGEEKRLRFTQTQT